MVYLFSQHTFTCKYFTEIPIQLPIKLSEFLVNLNACIFSCNKNGCSD